MSSSLPFCTMISRSLLFSLAPLAVAVAAPLPVVTPEVRALHERALVLDTHFDSAFSLSRPGWDVTQRHSYEEDMTQVDLPRLIEGGVDGGVGDDVRCGSAAAQH